MFSGDRLAHTSCPQDTLEIEKQSMFAGSKCNLETVLRNIILCPRKPVATTIYPKWVHEPLNTWNMSAYDIQNIGNHINTYLQLHLKIGWRIGTEFHFCHQLHTETTPARRGYARSFIRIPAKFTFKNGSGTRSLDNAKWHENLKSKTSRNSKTRTY